MKSILIVTRFPFPVGLAATNRMIAYSKGLVESGCHVRVLMPYEIIGDASRVNIDNDHSGINYRHTYPRKKSKHKLLRALAVLSGFRLVTAHRASSLAILDIHKNCRVDALFVASDNLITMSYFSTLARRNGIRSFFITDEFPTPIRNRLKDSIPMWKESLFRLVLREFDAYVVISDSLRSYYNELCPRPTHVMHLITDTSRFYKSLSMRIGQNRKYFCYMGNMELYKDNVDLIIRAFSLICNEISEIDLFLFGNPSLNNKLFLEELISELELENRVFLKGVASYDDVPDILMNAELLLASQPNTRRASGGFPTKLGEYLASGKPSIVTRVGENDKYFNEEQCAYFVSPENIQEYAETIMLIMRNYEEALRVARNGKTYIEKHYSHTSNGRALSVFIDSILNIDKEK